MPAKTKPTKRSKHPEEGKGQIGREADAICRRLTKVYRDLIEGRISVSEAGRLNREARAQTNALRQRLKSRKDGST